MADFAFLFFSQEHNRNSELSIFTTFTLYFPYHITSNILSVHRIMLLLFPEMMWGKVLCRCCIFIRTQYLAQNLWDPGQNLNVGSLTQIFLRFQDDTSKTLKQALGAPAREVLQGLRRPTPEAASAGTALSICSLNDFENKDSKWIELLLWTLEMKYRWV